MKSKFKLLYVLFTMFLICKNLAAQKSSVEYNGIKYNVNDYVITNGHAAICTKEMTKQGINAHIDAGLFGTIVGFLENRNDAVIIKWDNQIFRVYNDVTQMETTTEKKRLNSFESNVHLYYLTKVGINNNNTINQSNPTSSSAKTDKAVEDFFHFYEANRNVKISNIATKVSNEIATSICPNTSKDIKSTILSKEDKGNYVLLDLKSEWTGKTYGLGSYETFLTKERIYLTEPNFEISKIENYYKSPNVAQVWSTSDVVAGLAVLVTGAAIMSSGDDSKKGSSSTSTSNNSSSSSKPTIRSGERIKDGVEIVSWSSRNGIITAGNNDVRVRLRNKNTYDVIVRIELLNNSGQWERNYKDIHIKAGGIVDVETLGRAWEESKDIGIYSVE